MADLLVDTAEPLSDVDEVAMSSEDQEKLREEDEGEEM